MIDKIDLILRLNLPIVNVLTKLRRYKINSMLVFTKWRNYLKEIHDWWTQCMPEKVNSTHDALVWPNINIYIYITYRCIYHEMVEY